MSTRLRDLKPHANATLKDIMLPRAADMVVRARALAQIKQERRPKLKNFYRALKTLERAPELLGKKKTEALPDAIKAELYMRFLPQVADIDIDQAVKAEFEDGVNMTFSIEDFYYLLRYFEAIVAYSGSSPAA